MALTVAQRASYPSTYLYLPASPHIHTSANDFLITGPRSKNLSLAEQSTDLSRLSRHISKSTVFHMHAHTPKRPQHDQEAKRTALARTGVSTWSRLGRPSATVSLLSKHLYRFLLRPWSVSYTHLLPKSPPIHVLATSLSRLLVALRMTPRRAVSLGIAPGNVHSKPLAVHRVGMSRPVLSIISSRAGSTP